MIILLVATLRKSGKAERMLKKKNMNTHEYTRMNTNIFLNTNYQKLTMNFSKNIYDYSWVFMIIHVEKKKNTNIHEYEKINYL